jgi:hypothetical protein
MAEATQYTFKHQELLRLLIKAQGLREGNWMLTASFTFSVANVGPNADDVNPAAVAALASVGLMRVDVIGVPALTLDAAVVNPV